MKFINKFILFLLFIFCILHFVTASTIQTKDTHLDLADIQLKNGEAAVWYLYHSGWAVKTSSAFLIFDYWELFEKPENPSLFNGFIDPNEIKGENVFVFISHGHGDHFDEKIMEWGKVIPQITYIFGWPAPEAKSHFAFGKDRISKSFGPPEVKNIFHNFDGIPESAFLIDVDGITIFYSGDHGNSPGALNPIYKGNIDYLSQQSDEVDLIFLPIFGSPSYEGELYAVEKFKPSVMMPMHLGAREAGAKEFVTFSQTKYPKTKFWYPLKQGDNFLYKNRDILPLK